MRAEGEQDLRSILTGFVESCAQPAVLDLGEEPLHLRPDCWTVSDWNGRAVLQVWDEQRNLVRKVTGVKEQRRDRLLLHTERFPKLAGELQICDMAAPGGKDLERRSIRTAFRESVRLMLARAFPDWQLGDLSAEPNLEQSLSPSYVRAFLKQGSNGLAAMAAPPDCIDPAGIVPFALIWLNYLRGRERAFSIRQLVLFVPRASERGVVGRVYSLRTDTLTCSVLLFDDRGRFCKSEPWSEGNLGGSLPACRRPELPNVESPVFPRIPGVECLEQSDGSFCFQVRGLEFGIWKAGKFSVGIGRKRRSDVSALEATARELLRVRNAGAEDRLHPLYLQRPEGWMEAQVRENPAAIDPMLRPVPLYGQIPFATGSERGIADLLGVDSDGRLAVVELKASADIQLPFQALDYWMRIVRHLQAGDFERCGYFPGVRLRREPPRIFLAAPALEFHSTTEAVLSYVNPEIQFVRIGLAADWRRELRVMFRLQGAQRPE